MRNDQHPERVWIVDKAIHCSVEGLNAWEVPLEDLRVVGEYTTPNGPYLDDYFIVFISDDLCYEVSFYARGQLELWSGLSEQLGEELACGLQDSTDWKSRVIWPSDIKNAPLFDIMPSTRPNGLWKRLKYKLLSPKQFSLTNIVRMKMKPAA